MHIILILYILIQSYSPGTINECAALNQNYKYPVIAHSHNDYEQKIPIFTALEHGFGSLEVDIAFDGKDLKVSHDEDNLNDKPPFESFYLQPLIEKTDACNQGLILLVDIKNYSAPLIEKLNAILAKYKSCLVSRKNPHQTSNLIQIILSGDIPRQDIIDNKSNEYLFIDGRLTDYDLNAPSDIVPLISMNFTDITNWDGNGVPDDKTEDTLRDIIHMTHSNGKMIRFWKTKDNESSWLALIDWGVDIIGVDKIVHFCGTMKKNGLTE